MNTIYLIRHGESQSNVDKTFTGQMNAPLSDLGRRQAAAIATFFPGKQIDRIYASDLSRAYETAQPLSALCGVPIEQNIAFREIYGGKWEGEKFAELEFLYPEDYALWRSDIGKGCPTDGEPFTEVAKRATQAVEEIVKEHPDETIVIASHAGPIRAMLATWISGSLENMEGTAWVPNASISVVEYKDGKFTPVEMGITEHLADMITNLPDQI
jgi:broad specificity phosphatase PhoE